MSKIDRHKAPPPAAVRVFRFPQVSRARLDQGLTMLSAASGSVPVVTARLLVDAGVARETGEQSGIAQLVARTIDAGTSRRSADELAWELELLGAQFEAAAGWDSTSLSVTAPRDRMVAAMNLLHELATDARFPDSEVELARSEQLGEIMQTHSDPRLLANEKIVQFIYGAQSTYGRSMLGSEATVPRLTAEAVRGFHRERYAAADGALVMVGAVDAELLDQAAHIFGSWQTRPAATADFDPGHAPASMALHIVDRPGSVQSEIRVGHVGVNRLDPDYFPLQIMNALLGGAFTSRLNMNLRERQGWTYGVRSGFALRRGPGPFIISTAVGTETTAPALREILSEIDGLQQDGPTDEEVRNMRDYLAGVMPLEVQTTAQLAGKLSELFIYGLPDDYFRSYGERIMKVSLADTHRVARQHIRRDQLVIAIVGDAQTIEGPVRELGLAPLTLHPAND